MREKLHGIATIAAVLMLAFALTGCMSMDFLRHGQQASGSSAESEAQESESPDEEVDEDVEEPAGPLVETCDVFRLTIPEKTAELLTVERSQDNCLTGYYEDTPLFELAAYDTFDKPESEAKHRDYSCGFGADADGWHEVTLSFFYMASNNEDLAHWGDKDATTLSLTYLTGLSENDIADGVELQSASGENVGNPKWRESYPTLALDDPEAQAQAVAEAKAREEAEKARRAEEKARQEAEERAREEEKKAREQERKQEREKEQEQEHPGASGSAFWGVLIASCKDPSNAETFATEARSAGFSGATVLTSTDWENLNPERWYVVTLGQYASQADAEAALEKARKVGYSDAYVRYSGNPK